MAGPSMGTSTAERKQHHLDICLDSSYRVESGDTALNRIELPHRAMPEIDARSISLTTDFVGHRLNLPILISGMTGGSRDGASLNLRLAQIAGERRIAIGTGSIRVMLQDPDKLSHFQLKSLAPDVPVLANIGAAQLSEYSPKIIAEAVKRIGADGLFVHLNSAQELFQSRGDWNFSGWFDGIRRLLDEVDFPVLVKETGCGITPAEGVELLKAGAAYVDISGRGGTDWVAVETYRKAVKERPAGESFRGWGYSTGLLLLAYRQIARAGGEVGRLVSDRIIASGGLRTPRDFVTALACGASMAAAALPFIRKVHSSPGEVHAFIDSIEEGLKAALVLTGAGTLEGLRGLSLRVPNDLMNQAEELAEDALDAAWTYPL